MRIHPTVRRGAILGTSVAAMWLLTGVMAGQAPAEPASSQPATTAAPSSGYLRVLEAKGKSISLEIASRTYARPDGTGPKITLVGVVHIGDRPFYRELEKQLEGYDVVLYESVKPPGTSSGRSVTR